jgi:hypothetical protein
MAPEHLGAPQAGIRGKLFAGARLADAGLAHQQQHAAAGGEAIVHSRAQCLECVLASDEDAAGETVEGVGRRRLVDARRLGRGRHRGVEAIAHGGGRLRALLRVLREEIEDQGLETLGHVLRVPGRGHGRRVDVLRDDGHGVVAKKGRAAGDELVEGGAEGVEIAPRVGRAPERLLRRHVGGGADHHALVGEARALGRDGEAEVTELGGAIARDPDVAGLHVAVHHAVRVGVLEGATQLGADTEHLGRLHPTRVAFLLQALLEIAAGHVLAHDEELAPLLADVVDGGDVRVVAELRHGLGLSAHA